MILTIFAGPNGSGKSSVVKLFNPERYYCPDNYTQIFDYCDTEEERYVEAMKLAEKLRYGALNNGVPFAFETVLSNKNKIDFIREAQEEGYYVEVHYITTTDPSINIRRIKSRVSQGGHDVPEEKTMKRYRNSMDLLPRLISVSDEITVYDNSEDDCSPLPIFIKNPNGNYFLYKGQRPAWCDDLKDLLSRWPWFKIDGDLSQQESDELIENL